MRPPNGRPTRNGKRAALGKARPVSKTTTRTNEFDGQTSARPTREQAESRLQTVARALADLAPADRHALAAWTIARGLLAPGRNRDPRQIGVVAVNMAARMSGGAE